VFVILYSLTLAAGAGCVFYASIRPVTVPAGYFSEVSSWGLAELLIEVTWLAGPVALLIVGLIQLHRTARHRWWSAVAWVGTLAAGTAIGYLIMVDFGLLFTAYPSDAAGDPLGPSRWAPGTPYWQALIAMGGQLAVGAVMVALITAAARRGKTRDIGGMTF